MEKEIRINGCIGIPDNMDMDMFWDDFVEWLESKDCYFGGMMGDGTSEMLDGEDQV